MFLFKGIYASYCSSNRYNTPYADYAATCASLGSSVVTWGELEAARLQGLTCCLCGWTNTSSIEAYYPMAVASTGPGCGFGFIGVFRCNGLTEYSIWCKNDIGKLNSLNTL